MVIQVKLNSLLATATKWVGTNLEDIINMFGEASVARHGEEVSIYSCTIHNDVSLYLNDYVINLFGNPIVLTENQFMILYEDYPPLETENRWIMESLINW